jgi:hypothetical protein
MDTTKPQKKPLTCDHCGCEGEKHGLPYDENKIPCKFCERNPNKDIDIISDLYSENWVLTMLSDGKVQAGFDNATPHDRQLARLLCYAERFYGR